MILKSLLGLALLSTPHVMRAEQAGSSEANRQDLHYSLTLELIGLSPLPSSGYALGYFLKPSQLIEISSVFGQQDYLFAKIKTGLTGVRLKSFWGNSFYTNLGIAQRSLEIAAGISGIEVNANEEFNINAKSTSMGIDFGLGNRWQWENFTLGCDWIGYFLPLAQSGATGVTTNGFNADPNDIEAIEKPLTTYGKSATGQLLRFYLGFAF